MSMSINPCCNGIYLIIYVYTLFAITTYKIKTFTQKYRIATINICITSLTSLFRMVRQTNYFSFPHGFRPKIISISHIYKISMGRWLSFDTFNISAQSYYPFRRYIMPHTQMRVHSIYIVIYDISTQQTLVLYEFHRNSFKANLGILQNKATQIHHQILKYLKNLTENLPCWGLCGILAVLNR